MSLDWTWLGTSGCEFRFSERQSQDIRPVVESRDSAEQEVPDALPALARPASPRRGHALAVGPADVHVLVGAVGAAPHPGAHPRSRDAVAVCLTVFSGDVILPQCRESLHQLQRVQGSTNRRALGLVIFVPALAYHISLNLPAAFTQPGARLLVEPCSPIQLGKFCHFPSFSGKNTQLPPQS